MKKSILLLVFVFFIGLLSACGSSTSKKEETPKFPTKPINLIVPFAAGGSSDMSARVMAEAMAKTLGQPIVVINRPGASGGIGGAETAKAKPDGYTVLNASGGPITLIPYASNVGYNYPDNLRAVAQVVVMNYAISVNKESPIKTLKEFVEYARANPGKIRYGNPGAGGNQHIVTESWAKSIGIKLTAMPFEGSNPAVAALLGNHIESITTTVQEVASGHKAGALRVLGVTSEKRDPFMPDVPTFKEQGFDFVGDAWYGLVVGKDVPDEYVKILADATKKAYDDPKVQDAWNKLALAPLYLGPAEFDAKVKKEIERNVAILKELGLAKK